MGESEPKAGLLSVGQSELDSAVQLRDRGIIFWRGWTSTDDRFL